MKIDDATADEPGAFGTSWWCCFFFRICYKKSLLQEAVHLLLFFSFIDKDKMTQQRYHSIAVELWTYFGELRNALTTSSRNSQRKRLIHVLMALASHLALPRLLLLQWISIPHFISSTEFLVEIQFTNHSRWSPVLTIHPPVPLMEEIMHIPLHVVNIPLIFTKSFDVFWSLFLCRFFFASTANTWAILFKQWRQLEIVCQTHLVMEAADGTTVSETLENHADETEGQQNTGWKGHLE